LNIRRQIRKYKVHGQVPSTIREEYKKALAKHKESKRLAYEHRLDFLSDMALEYSITRNIKHETACKILKRAMESKRLYTTIRKLKTTSPPLSSLLVRSPDTMEYQSVIDTEEIFQHLIQRNVSVLKGGLNSKLIRSNILGDQGMTQIANNLLDGSLEGIDLGTFDETETNFLKALARPVEIPEMEGQISQDDVRQIFRKTKGIPSATQKRRFPKNSAFDMKAFNLDQLKTLLILYLNL
jgi:hypothetical protein